MTSVFTNLFGGGATPAADTAAVTSQVAGLSSNFNTMTGTLTSSLSTASALSPDIAGMVNTSALTNALQDAQNLQEMCKNLSPADCATKQAQQQAAADAAQLKFYKDALAASVTTYTDVLTAVKAQQANLQKEKDTALAAGALVFKGDSIFPLYTDLITRINTDISLFTTSVPYILPSTATSGSSSGSAKPPYQLPTAQSTASDYSMENDALILNYDQLMGNPYDTGRMQRSGERWLMRKFIPIAFFMTLTVAVIWGGIVLSNMYVEAEKDFIGTRVWYFIHGMLGFPAVLAYSLISPPFWVSGIFPWTPRVPVEFPKDVPAPLDTPIGTGV